MMVENRAFIERIAWYTVGIVNLLVDVDYQKKTMADGLGTGTACTWKGHRLILTAEHVIAKAEPKDLAFLLRVDEAINWEGTGKPEKVVERVSLPVERIVRCMEHDLAAIVLRTEELTPFHMQFCELPDAPLQKANGHPNHFSFEVGEAFHIKKWCDVRHVEVVEQDRLIETEAF